MKYLNIEEGEPICTIKDCKDKRLANKTIYLDSNGTALHAFNHFELPSGHFQLIPNTKRERDILYIVGSSGSGKSWFTAQYCKEYMRKFPKNDIYMVSNVSDDPSLKGVK